MNVVDSENNVAAQDPSPAGTLVCAVACCASINRTSSAGNLAVGGILVQIWVVGVSVPMKSSPAAD